MINQTKNNNIEYWKKIDIFYKNFSSDDKGLNFAIDVHFNKIKTCKFLKFACSRHIIFYYRWKNEKDFPFFYDEENVKIAYAFFQIQIIPEKRTPYILSPYRFFTISGLLGWRYKNDPEKILAREFFDMAARKQGKSTFHSILALWICLGALSDFEPRIFISGPQKESSAILYNICNQLISNNKILRKEFIKNNSITIISKQKGIIKKLAFEKTGIEGQNPTLGILTEFHLHPTNEMQESFKSAINKSRKNQLIIYDTTKGNNLNSPCFEFEKNYKFFLENQINNPQTITENADIFLVVAELDSTDFDNWRDPSIWYKSNPNLDITIDLNDLISEYQKIGDSKSAETEFKTKRLGIWVNQANAYFDLNDLLESDSKTQKEYESYFIDSEKYLNLNCIIGLDLSNNNDTTSVSCVFEIPQEDDDPIWIIKNKCFIPNEIAMQKEIKDRVPYSEWKLKNWVHFTNGKIIDYNEVANYIGEVSKNFQVSFLGFDKWQFHFIRDKILNKTFLSDDEIIEVKQNSYLTPAWKEFERKLKKGKIHFCNNKMLMNHFLNVSLSQNNKGVHDLLYCSKISTNDRIDAAIASISACYLFPKNNIISDNENFGPINFEKF